MYNVHLTHSLLCFEFVELTLFTIYTSRDDYDFSDIGMHKMYLYGALPSISYQFTF